MDHLGLFSRKNWVSCPLTTLLGGALLLAPGLGCGGDEVVGGGETAASETGDPAGGTTETGESGSAGVCEPLAVQPCVCPEGGEGNETCDASGEFWGPCEDCPQCGDGLCEAEKAEDCSSCEEDCGICLDCEEAPSCEAAALPDSIDTHLEVLDLLPEGEDEGMPMPIPPAVVAKTLASKVALGEVGVRIVVAALDPVAIAGEHPYVPRLRTVFNRFPEQTFAVRHQLQLAGLDDLDSYRAQFPEPRSSPFETSGVDSVNGLDPDPQRDPLLCEDPKLRIRLAKVLVHNEADLVFKDKIYCAIISEAMPGAEIRVTPTTFALDDGEEYSYSLSEGVVWGQLGEPVAPIGSLSMTYNCLEADGTGAFEEFLDAIANGALGADAIPGPYGWVLPVIGLAADIIGAALSLEQDDHLFNASQIIPAQLHLEMTQGVWWSVQRTGTFMLKNWHWELRMEAWGCTDDGIG